MCSLAFLTDLTASTAPPAEVVVFSDALDVDRCIELKQAADEAGIGASFGVGTNLTNGALAFYLASL